MLLRMNPLLEFGIVSPLAASVPILAKFPPALQNRKRKLPNDISNPFKRVKRGPTIGYITVQELIANVHRLILIDTPGELIFFLNEEKKFSSIDSDKVTQKMLDDLKQETQQMKNNLNVIKKLIKEGKKKRVVVVTDMDSLKVN